MNPSVLDVFFRPRCISEQSGLSESHCHCFCHPYQPPCHCWFARNFCHDRVHETALTCCVMRPESTQSLERGVRFARMELEQLASALRCFGRSWPSCMKMWRPDKSTPGLFRMQNALTAISMQKSRFNICWNGKAEWALFWSSIVVLHRTDVCCRQLRRVNPNFRLFRFCVHKTKEQKLISPSKAEGPKIMFKEQPWIKHC